MNQQQPTDLYSAVAGDADMPDSIRPLSWLAEMISECRARGPAADCEDTAAWSEMIDEVQAMHDNCAAAIRARAAAPAASTPTGMRPAGWLTLTTGAGGQLCGQHYESEREAREALPHAGVGAQALPCYVLDTDASATDAQTLETLRARDRVLSAQVTELTGKLIALEAEAGQQSAGERGAVPAAGTTGEQGTKGQA